MKDLRLSLLFVTVSAVLLSSCPEPLSEDVVIAAEDQLVPSIEVISPTGNDAYYSQVDFSLEIIDDAKSEGDGKGDIASIEFSVSNDDFRGGRIEISGGSVTQDSSAGTDDISYDSSSGLTTFSFSTVDPNPLSGYISVTVKATDRNGNETEERISLSESTGPWVEMSIVDDDGNENKYIGGDNVHLSGTLGNSSEEQGDDDEVYSISWTLADTIQGELVLDQNATYEDSYNSGTFLNYYNEAENRYERLVRTIDEDYADYFYYYPATRTFEASPIYMIDTLSGTVLFNMTVTDLNGHETESNLFVSENTLGPAIIPKKVDSDYYSHFSTATENADEVTGTLDITTEQIKEAGYFRYSLQYDGQETADFSFPGNGININDAENKFSIDYKAALKTLDNYPQLSDGRDGEEVKIYIEAAFNAEQTSNVLKKLVQDNTAPTITGFSFTGDQGGGAYANENSTLEFSFTISENLELQETNELSLDIDLGSGTLENGLAVGTGAMSFDYTGAEWNGLTTTDTGVPFTVTVEDRLGNTETYSRTTATSPVTFYDGTESSATFLTNTISADGDSTVNAEDNWARKDEDVLLEISSSRDTYTPTSVVILVDGANSEAASTTAGSGDFNYKAAHTGSETDGAVTMAYSIMDKAGNSYNVSVGGITLDAQAPVLGAAEDVGLTLGVSGTGAVVISDIRYLTGNSDDNEQLVISGLGSALDANYSGFRYKLFSGSLSSLNTGTGTVSVNALDSGASITGQGDAEYTALIQVTDIAGNTAEKSFSVFLDTTPPEITVTRFNSNNDTNSNYAREGDTLYLDFGITDTMIDTTAYVFELYGENVTSDTSNTSWTYTRLLGASDTDYNNNTIPMSISAADMVGNVSTVTDSDLTAGGNVESSITYYKDDLDGTLTMTFGGELSYPGVQEHWTKVGDDISLTINHTTPRDMESYSVQYGSNDLTTSDTGNTRTFSYEMTSSESDGQVSLDIALKDRAGNELNDNSYSVDDSGYTLYFDKTLPTVADLTLSLDESTPGVPAGGGYVNSYYDDSEKLDIDGLDTDLDANYYSFAYKVFNAGLGGQNVVSGSASVNLLDDGGSFAGKDGETPTATVRIYDKAGNFADKTLGFTIDISPPDFSGVGFTPGGGAYVYADPVHYFNSGIGGGDNELAVSGIASPADYLSISYSFDDDVDEPLIVTSGSAAIDVDVLSDDTDGTFTATIKAVDAASNISTKSFELELDTTAPATAGYSTSMSGDGGFGTHYINGDASDDSSFDFSSVDADCAGYKSNVNGAGFGGSITSISSRAFSVDVSDLESESDGDYTVTIRFYDEAENSSADISETVTVDTARPTLKATQVFALGGSGVSGDYFNSGATEAGSHVDITGVTDTTATDYLGFKYSIDNGSYSDIIEDTVLTMAVVTEIDVTSSQDDHYDLEIRAVDKAGNVSSAESDEYRFYVDTIRPTVDSVSGNAPDTQLVVNFTDPYSPLVAGHFSLTPVDDAVTAAVATTDSDTVTCTAVGNFVDSNRYRLNLSSSFSDTAGNSSYTTYEITYGTWGFTASGLDPSSGSLDLTVTPDEDSSGSSGAYKQRPGRMSAENSYTESPEGKETLSAEIRPELPEEKKALRTESLTTAAGADTLQRPPSRVVNRPDLNTGIEALSRAMEQVERNRAEYRALLTELTPDEMNMGELLAMNEVLEPEIYEPLTLTVSASPLVAASAGEIELSLTDNAAEEESSRAAAYLVLKILIALTGIMLTALFLLFMKRLQK